MNILPLRTRFYIVSASNSTGTLAGISQDSELSNQISIILDEANLNKNMSSTQQQRQENLERKPFQDDVCVSTSCTYPVRTKTRGCCWFPESLLTVLLLLTPQTLSTPRNTREDFQYTPFPADVSLSQVSKRSGDVHFSDNAWAPCKPP